MNLVDCHLSCSSWSELQEAHSVGRWTGHWVHLQPLLKAAGLDNKPPNDLLGTLDYVRLAVWPDSP